MVEFELEVFHDDREVEFHSLLEPVRDGLAIGMQDLTASCEMLAQRIAEEVESYYAERERQWCCTVWEDGECGGRVSGVMGVPA